MKDQTHNLLEELPDGPAKLSQVSSANASLAAPTVSPSPQFAPGATAAAGMEVAKNVQNLGFPEFTKGLIDGTFDAIIGANIKQVESYSTIKKHNYLR